MALFARFRWNVAVSFHKNKVCLPFLTSKNISSKSTSSPTQPEPRTQPSNGKEADPVGDEAKREGWLSKLFVRRIETGTGSHSSMLSDKDTVYELQIHSVKPECMSTYLDEFQTFNDMISSRKTGAHLSGSWTVEVGDLDQAVHIWKFDGGYPSLNQHKYLLRTNEEFTDIKKRRNTMLRSRQNQILLAFSFWGDIKPREGNNIYELRSYVLKPGTMIEWANNWARGLKYRQASNEPVGGLFSNLGDLYVVHHIWAYESLQSRKEVREAAWSRPGWDDCVAHTVPLIRHMTSRILIPTSFSPLQ